MTSPRIVQQFASLQFSQQPPSCPSLFSSCGALHFHVLSSFRSISAKSFNPPSVGPISGTRTELVETEEENGLVDLEAKDGGLNEAEGLAVDLDKALTLLAVCDSSGGLLLAEALDRLNGRHFCGCVDGRCVERSIRSRRASLGWSSVGSICASLWNSRVRLLCEFAKLGVGAGGAEMPTFQRLGVLYEYT